MSNCLASRPPRLTTTLVRHAVAIGVALVNVVAAAQPVGVLTLDEAARLATAQSRQIAATQAQAQAARDLAVAAAQRPDPVIRMGISNLPADGPNRFTLGRDFMTMRSIGVMQEFTRTDKREARASRAGREADVAHADERSVVSDVQRAAALAWLERSFQQSLRELLDAQTIEAEQQAQAADVLYRSGRGAQADVFVARAEIERVRDDIDQVDRAIAVATTWLARWVGDAAQRPGGPRPAFEPPAWTRGDLAAHLERHPTIDVAAQRIALAQADAALAQADKRSDWSVELMYSVRGSSFSNMLSINLSVPLQWDQPRRQDRKLAAALAMAERAAAEHEDRKRAVEADVRAMLQAWETLEQRRTRYGTSLLPLARQRGEAALTAYRAGTGTLPAVLAARRAELDTRIERLRIEMDIARLWAQLNYLLPDPTIDPASAAARSQP